MKRHFRMEHYLRLRAFVDRELLKWTQNELSRTSLKRFRDGHGSESSYEDNPAGNALIFLLNNPDLFQTIRELTGCRRVIRCFTGRAYKLLPEKGDHMHWHDDKVDERLAALSINLGRRAFQGGRLCIREKKGRKILAELANTTPGDAVLFRVSDSLEHCVTPVEGPAPKESFAGWFRSSPRIFPFSEALGRP